MFRVCFFKNLKPTLLSKKIQRSSFSSLLYKSSMTKFSNEAAVGKHTRTMGKEIFFPPIKTEGIKDKVALVTGGTDRLGLRCVSELLKCGARGVMIADSNETKGYNAVLEFSKTFGADKIAFIQINPASYVLLKNAFISTISFYKGLDIVINNVRFREKNWEDQVDEYVKGIVLSTQLSLEFMGRNNGGNGGVLVNVASDFKENSESEPLFMAVEDFIVRFDRSVACTHFESSDVKVLTICKATLENVGCDLATVLTRGNNGCIWKP